VRGLTLGILSWSMLGAVVFLSAMGIAGSIVTSRRIGSLLRT